MHARTQYGVAALVVVIALGPASSAQGAITVGNANDSGPGSLRQAIIDAPPGEVPAGTYTLTSDELSIEKSLTISGHGSGDTIIRSGGPFRVFDIGGEGNSVTISDVTISDGHEGEPGGVAEGAGLRNEKASLTLRNVVVTNNHADVNGTGGGQGGSAEGGGILSVSGALTIENSSVSGNSATATGDGSGGGGVVEGGGLGFYGSGPLTILGSTFADNVADARGGSGGEGGVIEGGGAYIETEPMPVTNISTDTVSGNVADASGGSGAEGGVVEGAGLHINSNPPSSIVFANLTIASNTARANGSPPGVAQGGGLLDEGGPVSYKLVSATLVANAVDTTDGSAEGGNIYSRAANSIVSGGKGPAGSENCAAKLESQGFNLESADQCGFTAVGDQVNKDPLLGPLQDNGGPTQTMAPAASSPAVDQGDAFGLTTDQRGVIRPIDFPTIPNSTAAGADGSDIGAFELQPTNAFTLGKLKKNKKKGTAKLTVKLQLPSVGTLTLSGKGLKKKTVQVGGAETVILPVIGTGKVKKALRRRGKRKVKIQVTYSPTGNSPATQSRTAKLIRKHRKHKKHKGPGKHR